MSNRRNPLQSSESARDVCVLQEVIYYAASRFRVACLALATQKNQSEADRESFTTCFRAEVVRGKPFCVIISQSKE